MLFRAFQLGIQRRSYASPHTPRSENPETSYQCCATAPSLFYDLVCSRLFGVRMRASGALFAASKISFRERRRSDGGRKKAADDDSIVTVSKRVRSTLSTWFLRTTTMDPAIFCTPLLCNHAMPKAAVNINIQAEENRHCSH